MDRAVVLDGLGFGKKADIHRAHAALHFGTGTTLKIQNLSTGKTDTVGIKKAVESFDKDLQMSRWFSDKCDYLLSDNTHLRILEPASREQPKCRHGTGEHANPKGPYGNMGVRGGCTRLEQGHFQNAYHRTQVPGYVHFVEDPEKDGRWVKVIDKAEMNKTYKEALDYIETSAAPSPLRQGPSSAYAGSSAVGPRSSAVGPSSNRPAVHVRAHAFGDTEVVHVSNPGGSAAVGFEVSRENPGSKVGIVLAGNSGRPGGKVRGPGGKISEGHVRTAGYTTQEEPVVSNWLLSSENASVQFARISNVFGLINPDGKDTRTIQGVDYTKATPDQYGDAWCVEDVVLSDQRGTEMDLDKQYMANLIFCAGPNASPPNRRLGSSSSMRRTYNEACHNDPDRFFESQMMAVYAALVCADETGCDHVVMPFVSGGLYAGRHAHESHEFFSRLQHLVVNHYLPSMRRTGPFQHIRCVHFVTLD